MITLTSSCSPVLLKIYGMKKMKGLTKDQVRTQGMKYGVPEADSYELDTTYATYLFSLDTSLYQKEQKNHFQPLQALYYNREDSLISFHINCDAGGFPNLKWNRFGAFDVFPPTSQINPDRLFSMQQHLEFLHPLGDKPIELKAEQDYYVMVYWSRFMGRQSKRLIRLVQQNVGLSTGDKVQLFYVNNDNIYQKTIDQ